MKRKAVHQARTNEAVHLILAAGGVGLGGLRRCITATLGDEHDSIRGFVESST